MILTENGVLKLMQRIKSFIASQLNTKASSVHTHSISEIENLSSQLGGGYTKSEVDTLLNGKSDTSHTHTKSQITDFPSYGTTANTICEGNDSRLSDARTPTSHTHTKSEITDFPTIPTVNNATLKIQKNGTDVKTFTANASSDVTCNITVPTKTSELTNDSCIPLSGTNALGGNIIPSTNISYNLGSANYRFREGYFGNLWVGGLFGGLESGIDINYQVGANLILRGKNRSSEAGIFWLVADDGSNSTRMMGSPDGTLTWGSKNLAMQEDTVPRSGGAVMTGHSLGCVDNTGNLNICGGTIWSDGGFVALRGKDSNLANQEGTAVIGASSSSTFKQMTLYPDGTWTWDGQPVQTSSDQRLKQQITEIDDKLLDAWQDVDLVQFKYNDAVEEKGDNARLHTGYVVQQIDDACKSHNVDISDYGLYCHEDYPEETEEVEIEQDDGTIKKETKVIREASEHYSLRYTETLVVECAYLRREVSKLKQQNENLEQRLKMLEQSVK